MFTTHICCFFSESNLTFFNWLLIMFGGCLTASSFFLRFFKFFIYYGIFMSII